MNQDVITRLPKLTDSFKVRKLWTLMISVTHFWHYGGTSVLGKRVCGIMHYAAIIISDPERVGGFLRSLLKISSMVYIDNDTLLVIYQCTLSMSSKKKICNQYSRYVV